MTTPRERARAMGRAYELLVELRRRDDVPRDLKRQVHAILRLLQKASTVDWLCGEPGSADFLQLENPPGVSIRRGRQAGTTAAPTASDRVGQRGSDIGDWKKQEAQSAHITPAGGNVFADLGFEPEEAAALKIESDRRISQKLAIRNTLMIEIVEWIEANMLEQTEATVIIGVTNLHAFDALIRNTDNLTIDRMIDLLIRVGKHVQLVVR